MHPPKRGASPSLSCSRHTHAQVRQLARGDLQSFKKRAAPDSRAAGTAVSRRHVSLPPAFSLCRCCCCKLPSCARGAPAPSQAQLSRARSEEALCAPLWWCSPPLSEPAARRGSSPVMCGAPRLSPRTFLSPESPASASPSLPLELSLELRRQPHHRGRKARARAAWREIRKTPRHATAPPTPRTPERGRLGGPPGGGAERVRVEGGSRAGDSTWPARSVAPRGWLAARRPGCLDFWR